MLQRDDLSGIPTGIWDVYEQTRLQDPVVDGFMQAADSGDSTGYESLLTWSLENETGIEASSPRSRWYADCIILPGRYFRLERDSKLAESIEASISRLCL